MSRKYESNDNFVCFLCDWWWLILLILALILTAAFTYNRWAPLISGEGTGNTLPTQNPSDILPTAIAMLTPQSTLSPQPTEQTQPLPTETQVSELLPTATVDTDWMAREGELLPNFSAPASDGNTYNYETGTAPTVIVFFASWCPYCAAEAPIIKSVSESYVDDGLQVIGVNITYNDTVQDANQFVEEHDWNFPILLDAAGDVSKHFPNNGVPLNVFVDRNGIVYRMISGAMDDASMNLIIQETINQ